MSIEEFVLAGLAPEVFPNTGADRASVVDPILSSPCSEHSLAGCQVCAERIRRAREVADARRKPAQQTEAVPAAIKPQESSATPIAEPKLIVLARTLADAQDQLQHNQYLLIGSEARVEFLKTSIVDLKAATEAARQTLFEFINAKK